MNRLEITTLGPLAIRIDGKKRPLGTRKQRALLALLIVNRRHTVSNDRIIMTLWGPDAPRRRREDVWVYISRLRKGLEPVGYALRRNPGGYVLDVEDDMVDSVRYEALVEEGRQLMQDDPVAASLVLGEALAAWSGGAFEEFENEEFLAPEIARLEESRLSAIEARIQADLAWRDTELLIPEIEGLATAHPLRAGLTESLMVALHRRGRQAEALRGYDRYATRLADEVGLQPPENMRMLEEQILMDNPASSTPARQMRSSLPERIATFVGRDTDLREVSRMLNVRRLVTVTGPGGIGKSSVAVEAARRLTLDYDDVVLVDVARSEQSGDVLSTVADALRIHRGDDAISQIAARLGRRSVLLIFDNCEPVRDRAAATIVELLQASAELRIIATSRVILGIPGEHIVRLLPLSTQPHGEAEQLLTERITSLAPDAAEAIDTESLRTLCVSTDGLPLSIELVASQLGTWPVEDVVAALDEPLDVLVASERVGPSHHREMRANIAWSDRLLPPGATVLLARLSAFRTTFSFDSVIPVAGFEPLTDTSSKQEFRRLVNASLVLASPGSANRYYLLDPVREYAAERLTEFGESAEVSKNHALYFADRFATLGYAIDFGTDQESLRRAQPDDQDVIAAITWMIDDGRTAAAQRFAISAVPFWRATASMHDVLPILDALLAPPTDASKTRAELLFMAYPMYTLVKGVEAGLERFAELEEIARTLDDPDIEAWRKLRRADAAIFHAAPDEVITLYRQAAASLHNVSSAYESNALHQLGWFQFQSRGHMDGAESTVAAWNDVLESLGSHSPDADVLGAWIALVRGHAEVADRALETASNAYRRQGDHRLAALLMLPRAIASLQLGDAAEAGRRADVSVEATREAGARPWLLDALTSRSYIRVALGDLRGAIQDLLEVWHAAEELKAPRFAAGLAHATATALAASQPEASATLLGAASSLPSEAFMLQIPKFLTAPAMKKLIGETEPFLRRSVDPARFDAAWARGSSMDATDTVTLVRRALGEATAAMV